MSVEFGAGGGREYTSATKRLCHSSWDVAFVTSRVHWVEEQNSSASEKLCHCYTERLNALASEEGRGSANGG
jgi:hypothetical protein